MGFLFDLYRTFSIGKTAIGIGKAINNASKESKKQKELKKQIERFSSRNILAALLMYVIGSGFCAWLLTLGTIGTVLVVLGLAGHIYNLCEIMPYHNVYREFTLTAIEVVFLLAFYFIG